MSIDYLADEAQFNPSMTFGVIYCLYLHQVTETDSSLFQSEYVFSVHLCLAFKLDIVIYNYMNWIARKRSTPARLNVLKQAYLHVPKLGYILEESRLHQIIFDSFFFSRFSLCIFFF